MVSWWLVFEPDLERVYGLESVGEAEVSSVLGSPCHLVESEQERETLHSYRLYYTLVPLLII